MIDIHYHLLYGLDDGPQTIEESLQLAEASVAEGVTHIVATPHANERYAFRPDVNRERLEELQARLGNRLKLGLGCDFHLSYDNIQDLARNREKYTINGFQYLLVEFPDYGISENMPRIFFEMRLAGVVPIITHPERNPTLLANMNRMADWVAGGCLVQVTAASLTGRFGERSKQKALDLVSKNYVHLIASDAHNLMGRPPSMRPAYSLLKKLFGKNTADRLCIDNPKAIFEGGPMDPQPEPLALHDADAARKGFWGRLFRK